jgi:uncharacterized protein (TIGR00730 family)
MRERVTLCAVSSVCVFCGSNAGVTPAFGETAAALGAELARRGLTLVYGGGHVGLMGAVADAALAAGGEVVGVMPRHLVDREIAHTGLTELVVTASMHERKARMAELADGFVAMPGGFGTIEEVVEVLTWNQLGLVTKPVVFLDVEGFWSSLLSFFDVSVDAGFVRQVHRSLAQLATSAEEAVDLATRPAPITTHKWMDLDAT